MNSGICAGDYTNEPATASKLLNSCFLLYAKLHLTVAWDVTHPESWEDNHPTYIP
jgi:hypothetical protein